MVEPKLAEFLAVPSNSLRLYANVTDQEESQTVLYDPHRLTENLQATIVSYFSDTPVDENGYYRWLTVLGYRQGGKSTTAALCMYPMISYQEGLDSVIIADTQNRADYLFSRVNFCYDRWPEEIRTPKISTREVRSLTLEQGSKMRVLTGDGEAVGIGQSVDLFLGSELAYWRNAARQYSLILPAMQNRKRSRLMLECTPAPLSESSAQWWMDKCRDSKGGVGRDLFAFFPFWDGKLNQRPWPKNSEVTEEERILLERYGGRGLRLEHLAFRRFTMNNDPEIRRNPELFGVYFPFDDVTCWIASGSGIIPAGILDKFHTLFPEKQGHKDDGYTEWFPPEPGAIYAIGVDPAGWGRDHHAFQVLQVWANEWRQVASYGRATDPNSFARILFDTGIKYNNALIGVERNGVGLAPIVLLREWGYPNIHYDSAFKPGVHKSNHDEWVSMLVDALLDKLHLVGEDSVSQVRGYRGDKIVERTPRAEILASNPGRRRARHHWDKVSALMVACAVAPFCPVRYRITPKQENVLLFKDMTWNQVEEYLKAAKAGNNPPRRRAHYRRRK